MIYKKADISNLLEEIIKKYFSSWTEKDIGSLKDIFSEDIIYTECYGAEYHGLNQVETWFSDWIKKGTVIEWTIKRFIHEENNLAVEWYFKCVYDNKISAFNGVSLVTFNDDIKIISIREFESKAEHHFPYES